MDSSQDRSSSVIGAGDEAEDAATTSFFFLWFHVSVITCLSYCVAYLMPHERNPSLFTQRLNWEAFTNTYGDRRDFKRHLRMSRVSFDKLLSYLRKDLDEGNEYMASLRGGKILPEIQLYCCIRWLAGGMYSDIYLFTGISCSSFYRVCWKVIDAINSADELKISFPKTREECAQAAAGFRSISFSGCIDNCVAVVDGYLLDIITPSKDEAKNVRSYFSGHYQRYGVNIQAACDHMSRFVFLAMAGPGVMGDRDAIRECGLFDLIEALPAIFTVIGDCAYMATEHMAPIYAGAQRSQQKYDAFNFYASQLRIRIEMAFGIMAKKWGILNRPLSVKLSNIKYLISAIARLHNYCIDERILEGGCPISTREDWEMTVTKQSLRAEAAQLDSLTKITGASHNRENMARKIYSTMNLRRPDNNTLVQEHRQQDHVVGTFATNFAPI